MKRIFISYGHDDHVELARRLKANLETRGHEAWFDEDRLKPGVDWERSLEEGLNWCTDLVLLMTPHSVRRPDGYCLNELARALSNRLPVIPVMVVWVEPPLSICRIQWLDMRDCVPVTECPQRYELKRDLPIKALEEGTLDYEGTQSKLLQLLQPLDFFADIAQHIPNFVGREWLFERLDDWLRSPV